MSGVVIATVCNRGKLCPKELREVGCRHAFPFHSVGENVRGQVRTNAIKSFWSMLKRAYVGTFQSFRPAHLQRYVDEIAARSSMRNLDIVDIVENIAVRGIGRRLNYERLNS